jgi:hypothetical protein
MKESGEAKGGSASSSVGYPARYISDCRRCDELVTASVFLHRSRSRDRSTGGQHTRRFLAAGTRCNGTSMASPHVVARPLFISSGFVTDENGNGMIGDDVREVLTSTGSRGRP